MVYNRISVITDLRVLVPMLLILLGLAFLPLFAAPAEFIGDDYYYVIGNPRVTGFDWLAIWTKSMKIEYFPVTIMSYAMEYGLWGDSVRLYRLTNLLLMFMIGLVAWSLAIRFASRTGHNVNRLRVVAFGSLLICLLHPLNIESVASISNRKELLYVLFGLLAFRWYSEVPRQRTVMILAMAAQVAAQLAKGSGVIIPLLFIAYELWGRDDDSPVRARLPVVVPYLLVSWALFYAQFMVAQRAGVVSVELLSHSVRLGGIIRTANIMFSKLLWPTHLTYDYDLSWPEGLPSLHEMLLPLGVASLVVFFLVKKHREPLFYLALALIPLLPYLQLIPLAHNIKGQLVFYDHYMLFTTGLLVMPLTRYSVVMTDKRLQQLLVPTVLLIVFWVGYDYRLSVYWQTRESLYSRIIELAPSLPKGYMFLGQLYTEQGRYEEAKIMLNRVFDCKGWNPTFFSVHKTLGDAYAFSGDYLAAERQYRIYLESVPQDLKSLQNLSSALIELGHLAEARKTLYSLLSYYPADRVGLHNMQLVENKLKGY